MLVGDADQLAPVGAGKPFAELVASEVVPTARLTHIFRQAAGQHDRAGRPRDPPRRAAGVHGRGGHAPRPVPDRARRARARRWRRSSRSSPSGCRPTTAIDPSRTSRCSRPCTRASSGSTRSTRAARGPEPARQAGPRRRLRIGDKLMMTGRNLHELGLMNGTLLRLLDEIPGADGDDAALLLRSDEQIFRLPPEEAAACGSATPARCIAARASSCRSRSSSPTAVRRVLPAARDALHGGHAGEAGDGDRRQSGGGGSGGSDAGYGSPLLAAGRAAPRCSVAVATPPSRITPPIISVQRRHLPEHDPGRGDPGSRHQQCERDDGPDRVTRQQRVPDPVAEQRTAHDHRVERAPDRQPGDVCDRVADSCGPLISQRQVPTPGSARASADQTVSAEAACDLRPAREHVADRPRQTQAAMMIATGRVACRRMPDHQHRQADQPDATPASC